MGNILNVVNNDNNKKPKPDAVLLEEVQMLTDMVKVEIEDNNELMSSPSKFAKLARKSKAMNKAFQLE